MRKIFAILFAFIVLFFNTGNLLAADSDYKNNLLKIEITKVDDNLYDLGLYTQKIYNEPVKVIKKSDTIYYLLLPETSHSITSVPPLDAIKNVIVKSYPYAGQDLNNGYTKVAIITSKPVEITTSLKTLDASVSPRLDPLRLARLDKVFERYSERLAQNNIPTPLAEFRKTNAAQRPAIQSNVDVSTKEVIASSNVPQTVKKPSVAPVQKQAVQTKPNAQPQQAKPVVQSKPVTKPVSANVQKQPVKQQTSAPVKVEKHVVVAQKVQTPIKTQPVSVPVKAVQTPVQTTDDAKIKTVQQEPVKEAKIPDNKAIELEKQLASTKPVDVEFSKKTPVDIEDNKEIQAEVIEPIENLETEAPKPNVVAAKKAPVNQQQGNNSNLLLLAGVFIVLLLLYIKTKKAGAQKKILAEAAKNNANEATNIKEFLKARAALKKQEPAAEAGEAAVSDSIVEQTVEQPIDSPISADSLISAEELTENEAPVSMSEEEEKVQAFNAYMESVADNSEESTVQETEALENQVSEILPHTEDDEVLKQLYTPIQAPKSMYNEDDSVAIYEDDNNNISVDVEEAQDDDVATIVSSSKLTETRGLYLAKFDGATSLVGYIQDDIYVLYNFGDMEVKETDIESRLAQENDTDSLYIVRTGGKKLMVKSTPYDMSLEMVM